MQDIFMTTCSGAKQEEIWKAWISGSLAEMQQEESQLLWAGGWSFQAISRLDPETTRSQKLQYETLERVKTWRFIEW